MLMEFTPLENIYHHHHFWISQHITYCLSTCGHAQQEHRWRIYTPNVNIISLQRVNDRLSWNLPPHILTWFTPSLYSTRLLKWHLIREGFSGQDIRNRVCETLAFYPAFSFFVFFSLSTIFIFI